MPQANNTENPIINMILSLEGQTLSSRQVYEALLERGFHGEKQSVINTLNTMRKQGLISVGHKGCAKVYTITPPTGVNAATTPRPIPQTRNNPDFVLRQQYG